MKKPILIYCLCTLCLLMSTCLVNASSSAITSDTISVDGDYYLPDNVSTGNYIRVKNGKTVTIDLNGYTYSSSNDSGYAIKVETGGSLTINGEGSVECTYTNSMAIYVTGSLVINSGTYDGTYVSLDIEEGATCEINGGTFNKNITVNSGTLTISGGTFANDVSDYVKDGYVCKQQGTVYVVEPKSSFKQEDSGSKSITCAIEDINCDGVITCDEVMEDGVWDEENQVCTVNEPTRYWIPNTSVKGDAKYDK